MITLHIIALNVTEVGQSLDPQIRILLVPVLLLIRLAHLLVDAWILTPFENFFRLVVVDVECKQFLAQVQALAAVLDTFVVLVDLEQEEHVVLVNLTIAIIVS